jgi:hypothetical protein
MGCRRSCKIHRLDVVSVHSPPTIFRSLTGRTRRAQILPPQCTRGPSCEDHLHGYQRFPILILQVSYAALDILLECDLLLAQLAFLSDIGRHDMLRDVTMCLSWPRIQRTSSGSYRILLSSSLVTGFPDLYSVWSPPNANPHPGTARFLTVICRWFRCLRLINLPASKHPLQASAATHH